MIHSDINAKIKRDHAVDPILKPDAEGYDPFKLFEYDEHTHKTSSDEKLNLS